MTEAACRRHKADKRVDPDWMPVSNKTETTWAIAEIFRCMRCGNGLRPRIALHTLKSTQRESMVAYGLPQATVDGFFPPKAEDAVKPKESKAVEAPLTSWPFPVSAHADQPKKRTKAAHVAA